jgi:hypothetical protein
MTFLHYRVMLQYCKEKLLPSNSYRSGNIGLFITFASYCFSDMRANILLIVIPLGIRTIFTFDNYRSER